MVDDLIDVMEERGHHCTIWTYKDIGVMGPIYAAPESEWMRRIGPILKVYRELRCDAWYLDGGEVDDLLTRVAGVSKRVTGDGGLDEDRLLGRLRHLVRAVALPEQLLPLFAERFRDMDEEEIDRMMQSFSLDRCQERTPLVDVLRRHMRRPATAGNVPTAAR